MSLREPKSEKSGWPESIFIGFYVPALTPRLNSIETSPQLSESITFFAVCHIYTGVIQQRDLDRHLVFGGYHFPVGPRYIAAARATHKALLPTVPLLLRVDSLLQKRFYKAVA
jgi:hypothetical protein